MTSAGFTSRYRLLIGLFIWMGAGVLIAVLLSESALRLFPGLLPEDVQLRVHWRDSDLDPPGIADRELGFRYPPNRTYLQETREFKMTLHTDEHGLRNKSPWPAQAQIVVLGDSRAFGHGVSEDQMWTRLLANRLQPDTLINISLPGLAPQQYFRYFEKLGAPLMPKLVLLCLFPGNDIADARRFETWQGAGSPGNFAEWRFETAEALQVSREPPSVVAQLRLVQALTAIRYNLRSRSQSDTLVFPEGRVQLVPALYERRMSAFKASDPGFHAMLESVRDTRVLTDRIGARLLVVLFPTKEEVYLHARGASYPHMVDTVKQALQELPVDMLDLGEGLRRHANDSRPLFFEVDGHPNERGNVVVANLVFGRLQRENREPPSPPQSLLAPRPRPGATALRAHPENSAIRTSRYRSGGTDCCSRSALRP